MKRSEVMKELLNSYYFQHGKRVDNKVIQRTRNIINQYEKEENKLNKKESDFNE